MVNPTIFIDGDKKRIYEVPDLSSFIVDGSGYRIYTPDSLIGRTNEFVQLNFQQDIWSRFQDWHKDNEWSSVAIGRSGGASRGSVDASEVFASNDYSMLTAVGWALVPANYPHILEIFGNLLADQQDVSVFDADRITSLGVFANVRMADSLQTVVSGSGLSITQDSKLEELHGQVRREIFIDTSLAVNGNGYQQSPYNNLSDAIDYAELNGVTALVVLADIVLDRAMKNFIVTGIGAPTISFNGFDLKGSKFIRCSLEDIFIGSIVAENCSLLNNSYLNGEYTLCSFLGASTCIDGSKIILERCFSGIAGLDRPSLSMNPIGTTKLSIRGQKGGLDVHYCNSVTDEASIEVLPGSVTLKDTCTNGSIVVRGIGILVDESNGSAVKSEIVHPLTNAEFMLMAKAVWEYSRTSAVIIAGSMGEHVGKRLLTFIKFIGTK